MTVIEFWINGRSTETPLPDDRLGVPGCMRCDQKVDTGIAFRGDGAICRVCLDEIRNELWERMGRAISRDPKPEGCICKGLYQPLHCPVHGKR